MSSMDSEFEHVRDTADTWHAEQGLISIRLMAGEGASGIAEARFRQCLEALPGFCWLDQESGVGWFADRHQNPLLTRLARCIGKLGEERQFEGVITAGELHNAVSAHTEEYSGIKTLVTPSELLQFVEVTQSFWIRVSSGEGEGHISFLHPEAERKRSQDMDVIGAKLEHIIQGGRLQ